MSGHVLFAISLALLGALWFAVRRVRRAPPDPRGDWATSPAAPVWFEHAVTGERYIPAARLARLVVGAAGDCPVPGARRRHAVVRVFARDCVDIAPLAGPLHIGDHRVRAPVFLRDGERVRLGAVPLVAHVGWLPDPADPRIGAFVAGERLWERLSPRRYAGESVHVGIFDPPVDPVAYEARVRAAERAAPRLLRASTITADAIVVHPEGAPQRGSFAPAQIVEICRQLAPLHAAGLAHGDLADAVFISPGRLRLWPVAPTGDVLGDIQTLRRMLPPDWPDPQATDLRGFRLAVLRHGRDSDAFPPWNLLPCPQCGEPFARQDPPNTTMFDGRDASGRMFGGRITEHRTECLACDHVDLRVDREAYS